jgi:hypothetical protein
MDVSQLPLNQIEATASKCAKFMLRHRLFRSCAREPTPYKKPEPEAGACTRIERFTQSVLRRLHKADTGKTEADQREGGRLRKSSADDRFGMPAF